MFLPTYIYAHILTFRAHYSRCTSVLVTTPIALRSSTSLAYLSHGRSGTVWRTRRNSRAPSVCGSLRHQQINHPLKQYLVVLFIPARLFAFLSSVLFSTDYPTTEPLTSASCHNPCTTSRCELHARSSHQSLNPHTCQLGRAPPLASHP